MTLTQERCCELVATEIARLAALTEEADPMTPVPTCGDWTIADLLEHAGTVYRWAAAMVRDSAQERYRREEMDWERPEEPTALPTWVAEGAPFAVEQLRAADLSTPMWAWGWPKAAGFWPRRMVHEMGVHRADAELALGIEPAFDPEVAADGVDELLDNLPYRPGFAAKVANMRAEGEVLAFSAPDADASWRIELGSESFTWSHSGGPATTTVTAPARDLLLAVYGRPGMVELSGDETLFARWIANSSF